MLMASIATNPETEELIFQCECGGKHYLRLSWDFYDDKYRSIWIEEAYSPRFWGRIKDAVKILLGMEVCNTEIILSETDTQMLNNFFAAVDNTNRG